VAREAIEVGLLVAERPQPRGGLVQAIGPQLDVARAAHARAFAFLRERRTGAADAAARDAHHLRHARGGGELDVGLVHGGAPRVSRYRANTLRAGSFP
jgi:hypothetical protein